THAFAVGALVPTLSAKEPGLQPLRNSVGTIFRDAFSRLSVKCGFLLRENSCSRSAVMKQSVAIIGLGFVGRAHLESLRRLNIPVKGGMLSTAERGSSAAKSLGLEKSYATLAELAADKDITCVHICSPNHVHFEQASTLLRAGKHVLCE